MLSIFVPNLRILNRAWLDGKIDTFIHNVNTYGAYQDSIHDLHKWMTKYATLDSKTLEQVAKTIQTQRELMKEMIFEMRETRKDVNQFKHK